MVSDFEAARIAATGKVWLDRVVTKWTKVLVACPGQLSCQYCQSLGRCSPLLSCYGFPIDHRLLEGARASSSSSGCAIGQVHLLDETDGGSGGVGRALCSGGCSCDAVAELIVVRKKKKI